MDGSQEELDAWVDALLDGKTLDEMFAAPPSNQLLTPWHSWKGRRDRVAPSLLQKTISTPHREHHA